MPEEYVIPLSIDVAGIIQKASTTKTALSDVGEAAKKAGNDAKTGFDNAAKGSQDLGTKLVDNSTKYTQLTKNVEQLKIQLQSYQNIAAKSLDPKIITDYNKRVQELQTQITQLSNQGKKGFDDLGNAVAKTGSSFHGAFQRLREIAYILPGVGVAGLIGFFTGPIIEYISKLDIFKDKVVLAKANLDNLNEVSKNAAKQYGEQSTNLRILYEATQDVTNSEHDRLLAAQELQKEFPSLFGNIKTETILNGGAADAYRDATAAILENAKAKAALNKIQELAGKQLQADQEIQKIRNAESNEALRSAQQLAKVLQEGDRTQGRAPVAADKALAAGFDPTVNGFITAIRQRATDAIKLQQQNKTILQSQIDFLTSFAGGDKKLAQALIAGDKLPKEKDNSAALLAARKALLDQLVKLQNDYNTARIAAIDDAETKEVAQNDVNYQNKVRTLKQQQQDLIAQAKANKFPELASLIQDNIREISVLIAKTEEDGQAADLTIIAKYAALKLKAQQDSLRAIGVLLKDETDARIEAIRANYAKVTAEAKKNGVLTDDLQKKLIKQQEADISDVQSKAIDKRLVEVQELEEAGINASSKKKGQTQKDFEEQLQRELLAIDIKGTQQRIGALAAVLATQGGLTPDQTKLLGQLTTKLNKDLGQDESNKEADKLNIFRKLAIDQDTQTKVQQYAAAASQVGKITADIFGGLADAASQQVDAIQKQIDALSALLQADQDAVDKQQALSDKGRANSLDAAKKKLADDQKLKEGLQKQEEAAAKKRDQLQKAQIIADGIAQVSNLITAATEIYKSVSVIPVIGPALAFAAVAAMFAGFAVAKVTAFNSVNSQTAEEGGVAGGDRHSNGGNKYVSMDGKDTKILEIEKGERIFSRKNSEKHKRLFEAIQSNDYSKLDINDVSISDLLRGTGVMSQLEVARNTGNSNITLQDRANNVVIVANNSDKYLSSIDKKMDNLHRKEPIVIDFGDYIWIDYGNGHTERKFK